MITLRADQADLVARVAAAFADGTRAVVAQAPTGFGKTAVASEILRRSVAKGMRPLFLAHLDTLIEDTADRLRANGLRAGIVQANKPVDPEAVVQVCSLQTLHARGLRPEASFLVLDECHRALGETVRSILDSYPGAKLLGLTATPQRGDGKALGDVFQKLVDGPSMRALIDAGNLVPFDLIAPLQYEEQGLIASPLEAYQRHTLGQRAIVFAANLAHAEKVAREFNAAGIQAECITGETSRRVRQGIRDRLLRRETLVLVGVGVFIEGFDAPSVETIILARQFGVTGSFLQAIGRGLRPSPATGKTKCTILDLKGSVHLNGLPDEERAWSLDGSAVRRTEKLPSLKRCPPPCGAIYRPAIQCPRCGERVERAASIPRVLNRIERLTLLSHVPQRTRDQMYLRALERIARDRIKLPADEAREWAQRKFIRQYGRSPAA